MRRDTMVHELAGTETQEFLGGKLIDADEDLGGEVCGSLFGGMSDFYTDVFDEKRLAP